MITRISLKNFKLHASTLIEAAPITVFIGPNNSGKSSLFQALLTWRQAARSSRQHFCESTRRQSTSDQQPYLFLPEEILDVGEFKDVVRHGESEVQIGLAGMFEPEKVLEYPAELRLGFDVYIRENRLAYHKGSLDSVHGKLDWEWAPGHARMNGAIQVEGAGFGFSPGPTFRLIDLAQFAPTANLPPEKVTALQQFGEYLGSAPVQLLRSLHPIFPLRGFEEWGYPLPDTSAGNLDRSTLPDRAVALASVLAYDREMEGRLSRWLEELLGVGIEVQLLPGKRVTVRSKRVGSGDSDTLFVNEGTGANQLPFILVPIGLTPPEETILLCEPEAHLHPQAQSHLVRLLLEIAKKESRQFFIETHSEHILHAFLHAIAKGVLENDQVAIYYFEEKDAIAQVRRLEINSKGQVHGGLPGFFEHSLAELTEYLEALKKS